MAPTTISLQNYKVPVLSFLIGLSLASVGNILLGLIQNKIIKSTVKALKDPLQRLDDTVDKLRKIQYFYEIGVVGIYPNRASAIRHFKKYIELEEKYIDFVGTSMLGTIDPSEESDDKKKLTNLLRQKNESRVRIRALLMHPAYGEFRERVEGRMKAAVAKDIQKTLRYLIGSNEKEKKPLLSKHDVRLYPGVITAYAIFTSRAVLMNLSSLHGPVYSNLTLIIEDITKEESLYKKLREDHFEVPWNSDIVVRFDTEGSDDILEELMTIDFSKTRFKEGEWPKTIPDSD